MEEENKYLLSESQSLLQQLVKVSLIELCIDSHNLFLWSNLAAARNMVHVGWFQLIFFSLSLLHWQNIFQDSVFLSNAVDDFGIIVCLLACFLWGVCAFPFWFFFKFRFICFEKSSLKQLYVKLCIKVAAYVQFFNVLVRLLFKCGFYLKSAYPLTGYEPIWVLVSIVCSEQCLQDAYFQTLIKT